MLNAAMPGGVSDRRHYAQSRLGVMAQQPGREHPAALREIAAGVLGFDAAAAGASVAVEHSERSGLPDQAAAIATLSNEFGPDFTALHFDLSAVSGNNPHSYVTNARIQAANAILQQYAGGERYPLLLFTLPDNSGLQFVTGAPVPGNRYRLQDVRRATAYWNTGNRAILDCLEAVGNAIAHDRNPQRAFQQGFDVQPVLTSSLPTTSGFMMTRRAGWRKRASGKKPSSSPRPCSTACCSSSSSAARAG